MVLCKSVHDICVKLAICTLTTRNHIQSNMQDRLLQLVQIYQYQAHKIKFPMIILNELVGVDITLNYSSCFVYNAMGFDTSTVTQDCDNMDGYFGIKGHRPIPVLLIWQFFYLGKILLHVSTSWYDTSTETWPEHQLLQCFKVISLNWCQGISIISSFWFCTWWYWYISTSTI